MRELLKATLTFLTTTIILLSALPAHSTQTTKIYVNPKNSYPNLEQPFAVNVSIANVVNLHMWQLFITFNPEILTCTNVTVPEDNIFGILARFFPPQIDNTLGHILAACYTEQEVGEDGNGTLCQVEFNSKTPGISPITLSSKIGLKETYIRDPDNNLIPFEAVDGMAEIGATGFLENVFIVTQNSKTYHVIIFSNSTITSFNWNQDLKAMTFNISGPEGTIGSSSVVVSKELLNETMAVIVDGTAICYTLSVNATHNFLHFTYVHSTKTVKIWLTILADVNGDRIVDMADISMIIDAFMTEPGDPGWNLLADTNQDNIIDMADISIAIENFMNVWSP